MCNLEHVNVKLCKVISSCVKHAKCLSVNFLKRTFIQFYTLCKTI